MKKIYLFTLLAFLATATVFTSCKKEEEDEPETETLIGQEGNPRFNLKFTGSVDFDLYVKDPSGEVLSYQNKTSQSGGTLDVDCIMCEHGTENIFWTDGSAPSGTYEYWVHFYEAGNDNSSSYTVRVVKNSQVLETKTGSLSSVNGESQHWTYQLN